MSASRSVCELESEHRATREFRGEFARKSRCRWNLRVSSVLFLVMRDTIPHMRASQVRGKPIYVYIFMYIYIGASPRSLRKDPCNKIRWFTQVVVQCKVVSIYNTTTPVDLP
jgi:hypothetical protein